MKEPDFISKIQNKLYMDKGFSFNMEYGFHPPEEGFMVGGIAEPIVLTSIEGLEYYREEILKYLNHYADKKPNLYLGGWLDEEDGKIYIEPSEVYYSRPYALVVAKGRNEKAIYDLENQEDIYLKGEENENNNL